MCARIDGSSGPLPAYDVEPVSSEEPASTSSAPVVDTQTEEAPDLAGAISKRLESSLEANYLRGQLDQAQGGPGPGVLYDKRAHDPGARATEVKAAGSTTVVGTKLGTSKDGKDLQIKRDIGSPEGYDDEREAIAVARMAGTEPAAVVRINDKWHAVETSADPLYAGDSDTARQHSEGNVVVQGLPPYSEVEKLGKQIATERDRLQAEVDIARFKGILDKSPLGKAEADKNRELIKSGKLGEADNSRLRETLPENRKEIEQRLKDLESKYPKRLGEDEKKQLTQQLGADRQAMAPLLFGLPKSQIQFNASTTNDDPDKMINIDPMPPSRTGDILGREHYPKDQEFQPGAKPTFGIKLEEMDNPKEAAGVLFHEVSHLKDDQLAQKWVEQYQKEGHSFVSDRKAGMPTFQEWMNKQVGKQLPTKPPSAPLTKADAEIVVDKAYNFGASSEARAYVNAAIAAAQSGDKAEAISQLKTYATALKDGRAASPAPNSAVEAALKKQILDLYQKHPELRDTLKVALTAAQGANKDAWISKVTLPK
jgi:hypothetical protein